MNSMVISHGILLIVVYTKLKKQIFFFVSKLRIFRSSLLKYHFITTADEKAGLFDTRVQQTTLIKINGWKNILECAILWHSFLECVMQRKNAQNKMKQKNKMCVRLNMSNIFSFPYIHSFQLVKRYARLKD